MARLHVFPGEEVGMLSDKQIPFKNYTLILNFVEIYLLSNLPNDAGNRFYTYTHLRFQRRS